MCQDVWEDEQGSLCLNAGNSPVPIQNHKTYMTRQINIFSLPLRSSMFELPFPTPVGNNTPAWMQVFFGYLVLRPIFHGTMVEQVATYNGILETRILLSLPQPYELRRIMMQRP